VHVCTSGLERSNTRHVDAVLNMNERKREFKREIRELVQAIKLARIPKLNLYEKGREKPQMLAESSFNSLEKAALTTSENSKQDNKLIP
jgi:hypothetical protein